MAIAAQGQGTGVGAAMVYATALTYEDRDAKARYIADKYAAILGGSVLDVGCDTARLKRLVAHPDLYKGVDVNPAADFVVDLDRQDLPFADGSFDCVLCTDVLEHLERCHAVFDELCRVSRSRVVVSLPNPLRAAAMALFERSTGTLSKYGLPVDPPADRHRWFFGHEDAVRFVTERGRRRGFEVEQIDVESRGCYYWLDRQGRDVLGGEDVQAGTMWCVLRRVAGPDLPRTLGR